MIKQMRRKFIAITMGALFFLLAAILVSMNVYMNNQIDRQITEHLHDLAVRDGELPIPEPAPGNMRRQGDELIKGFAVKLNADGSVMAVQNENTLVDADTAVEYAREIVARGNTEGEIGAMRYIVQEKSYGQIIVCADKSIQDGMLSELRDMSYIIGGVSVVLLLGLVIVLSRLTTRPVEEAFDKQKRFIADSSHELKTPLSILSANADVLEMEVGKSEWLSQIKAQSKRMNALIHELLVLAKTESADAHRLFTEFSLSHAVTNTVLPFEVVAFEQGKQIAYDVEDDVMYKGDEQSIRKMVEALVDNAVKYAENGSVISVKLTAKGARKTIEVYNKGQGVTPEQKTRLFEKFYRTDDSRARETGGYGVGLSIVKNIVDMHKGKIEVESRSGEYILFRVLLTDR